MTCRGRPVKHRCPYCARPVREGTICDACKPLVPADPNTPAFWESHGLALELAQLARETAAA